MIPCNNRPLCLLTTLFLSYCLLIYGNPVNVSDSNTCQNILKTAGVSDNFGMDVAHAIHSLTLQELRKFEPSVAEENHIPTINMDLSSDDPILSYAPERKGPNDALFMTEGMKTLDEAISHMDDNAYDIKNSNPIEKIVHAFHMQELWHMIHHGYEKLKKNPPDSQVCACVTDIENNGILKSLRSIALLFREPYLVYGSDMKTFDSKPGKPSGSFSNPKTGVNEFAYNGAKPGVNEFNYAKPGVNEFNYNAAKPGVNEFNYNGVKPGVNEFNYNGVKPGVNEFNYNAKPGVNEFNYNPAKPGVNEFNYNGKPGVNEFNYNGKPGVNEFNYNGKPGVNEFNYNGVKPGVNEFNYNGAKPGVNEFNYNAKPGVNEFNYNGKPGVNEFNYNPAKPGVNEFNYNPAKPGVNEFNYNPAKPGVNEFNYNPAKPGVNEFNYNPAKPGVNEFNYNPAKPGVNEFNYNPDIPGVNQNANQTPLKKDVKTEVNKSDDKAKIRTKRQNQASSDNILKTRDQALPHLTSATSWQRWAQEAGAGMSKHNHHDAALFLYCSLNKSN